MDGGMLFYSYLAHRIVIYAFPKPIPTFVFQVF